jgi:DNA polymerase-3 subunit epsilon
MIVVDIEAAGLDPKKSALLSIGAVDFRDPERQFYAEAQIWEGSTIDPDSLAINGFTEEQCRDPKKETLEEVMHKFINWMRLAQEKTLMGQNPSFDRDFLNTSFGRCGISWGFSYRTLDLHTLAYTDCLQKGISIPIENGRTSLNLDSILAYVGLPKEPKPHNALMGAKLEAEAFSRILYGTNLLPEFAQHPIPDIFLK